MGEVIGKNKIIFLDHDGVIVLRDHENELYNWFDSDCVKVLNNILEITNAEIVVSSDWRNHYDLKMLGQIYEESDIIKKPISVTPDLYITYSNISLEDLRSLEIETWLRNNHTKNWVAIDDMNLFVQNFVQTNDIIGLTGPSIQKRILEFLR